MPFLSRPALDISITRAGKSFRAGVFKTPAKVRAGNTIARAGKTFCLPAFFARTYFSRIFYLSRALYFPRAFSAGAAFYALLSIMTHSPFERGSETCVNVA